MRVFDNNAIAGSRTTETPKCEDYWLQKLVTRMCCHPSNSTVEKNSLDLTLQQSSMQSVTLGRLATHLKANGISLMRSLFKYLTTYEIEVKTCIAKKSSPSIHLFLSMSANAKCLPIECTTCHKWKSYHQDIYATDLKLIFNSTSEVTINVLACSRRSGSRSAPSFKTPVHASRNRGINLKWKNHTMLIWYKYHHSIKWKIKQYTKKIILF